MEKATIYDYVRMCKNNKSSSCAKCPLSCLKNGAGAVCGTFIEEYPDKANEIILKWCKEHPTQTRQDRFLKMFPNARMTDNGVLEFCPQRVDTSLKVCEGSSTCDKCYEKYWLAEVE